MEADVNIPGIGVAQPAAAQLAGLSLPLGLCCPESVLKPWLLHLLLAKAGPMERSRESRVGRTY